MVNLEHPANAGIFQHLKQLPNLGRKVEISQSPQSVGDPYTSLLTHPDLVMQLWDKATRKLPERCSWIVYLRSCTSFNKGLPKKEKSERKGVIKI